MEDEESDGWANCVGALRAVYVMFGKYTGKLKVTIRLEVIQKAALLGTAGITESFFHFGTQTQGLLWGLRNLLLLALRQ